MRTGDDCRRARADALREPIESQQEEIARSYRASLLLRACREGRAKVRSEKAAAARIHDRIARLEAGALWSDNPYAEDQDNAVLAARPELSDDGSRPAVLRGARACGTS